MERLVLFAASVALLLLSCSDSKLLQGARRRPVVAAHTLGADREAFWARFIGREPGAPGPETIAWCRESQMPSDQLVIVEDELRLMREGETCALVVLVEAAPRLRQELREIVARWRTDARVMWLDRRNKLTAKLFDVDERSPVAVHWRPYLEVEELIGPTGKLLRDVDIERLVGQPATLLRSVARPPFVVTCEASACKAYGPGAAGGFRTEVFAADGPAGLGVRFDTADPHEILARIAMALGARLQTEADVVYRRGGIRYRVTSLADSVTVLIESD